MRTKIKRGDFIKIYQKPMTHEDYEGIAQVKRVLATYGDAGRAVEVSFRDDLGPYTRVIYEPVEVVPPHLSGFAATPNAAG